jgi:hypothetical protein
MKRCPECGHAFRGNGWDRIDWPARHKRAMPYDEPFLQLTLEALLDAWPCKP